MVIENQKNELRQLKNWFFISLKNINEIKLTNQFFKAFLDSHEVFYLYMLTDLKNTLNNLIKNCNLINEYIKDIHLIGFNNSNSVFVSIFFDKTKSNKIKKEDIEKITKLSFTGSLSKIEKTIYPDNIIIKFYLNHKRQKQIF